MPQNKKDGKYVNIYMDADLHDRLMSYCEKTGLTKTKAMERFIEKGLNNEEETLEKTKRR